MVKTSAELLEAIRAMVGEAPSDEAMAIMEDVADTMATLEEAEGLMNQVSELTAQLEELDASWRKKYADRFTAPAEEIEDIVEEIIEDPAEEVLTFDDLFEVEGE